MCSIDRDGHGFARALHRVAIEIRLVLAPPGQRSGAVPGLDRARFDPAPELGGALRAAVGILVEAREHDRFELGRDRDPSRRQRLRLLVEVLAAHLDDRLAVEDIDPREQVVGDRPEGVDVGAGVDRVRLEDGLRSHVLGRADDRAGAGQL